MFPRNPYAYQCHECGAEREDENYTPSEHGTVCPDCSGADQGIEQVDPEKVIRRYREPEAA